MIEGVRVKQLKMIPDERGRLMEILRHDDKEFIKFGQLYMTTAYPGVVKGWHYHKLQIASFCTVRGLIKLVLYDAREKSPTHGEVNEFFQGEHHTILVQIPNFVYHGFKCISETEAIVINCPTEAYHHGKPDEFRVPYNDPSIPYNWDIRFG
ncbi:MAG: dTDP-4-dehydrorhamnose 3,5-epimerase family protein [Candidatus Acidiferrales bacterium]